MPTALKYATALPAELVTHQKNLALIFNSNPQSLPLRLKIILYILNISYG